MNNQICSYLVRRNNVYYFSRRVPLDMECHYSSKRIVKSLKTRSKRIALRGSNQISFQLETYWSSIRVDQITQGLVTAPVIKFNSTPEGCGYDLVDVKDHYLRLKGMGKDQKFFSMVDRNIRYLIDAIGNRDLTAYNSSDGAKFRDYLSSKGLVRSSIKRAFASLRPMINLMIQEYGLDVKNPLANTYMLDEVSTSKRKPIPLSAIRNIQSLCVELDDDIRWVVALVSDTGLRLAEACGLERNDIVLEDQVPHIIIRPNGCRSLKTRASERKVPLVGAALWAVTQTIKSFQVPYRKDEQFLFPRYTKGGKCNANSASAALNKWLKNYVDDGCVIHSFRHSMRDRLRAVECPSSVIDQIGGWTRSSVGENYGSGYPLEVLHKWLKLIE
jgi:integrase